MHDELHATARSEAETLRDPDRKQLRFNEIAETAKRFYPEAMISGVREMVQSCDRAQPGLYVAGRPMWRELRDNYGWMFPGA